MTSLEVIRKRLKELLEMGERANDFPPRVRFAKRRLFAEGGPNNVDCPAHWGTMLPSVAEHFEEYLSSTEHKASRTALPACLEAIEELAKALDRIESLSYLDEPVKMGEVASQALARAAELLNQTNERKEKWT